MVLLMVIFGCFFAATLIITFYAIPEAFKKYQKTQEEKAQVVQVQLEKMYFDVKHEKIYLLYFFGPLALAGVGIILLHNVWAGVIFGAVIGLPLPALVVNFLEKARKAKFHGQLIDSLMILSSSLKAGLSLRQAMEVLVEEMPPPICQEVGMVLKEEAMGVSLEEALQHLNERMPSEEMNMIATAIAVGKETGGDLNKIFTRLTNSIRHKEKIKQSVKTLTLQGKIQGWVMSLLPIAFGLVMYQINKDFFKIMLSTRVGQMMLGYAAVSLVIGMIMVKKISTIEV